MIGSCLREKPWPFWRSAKKKLSKAKPISSYHTENLLNRLETSTGALDRDSKQCFLDLGAFPKGKKFSVEALLDIWVYVRGMEWDDAFVVWLELAQKNLLNLTSEPGYGNYLHLLRRIYIYVFIINSCVFRILSWRMNF